MSSVPLPARRIAAHPCRPFAVQQTQFPDTLSVAQPAGATDGADVSVVATFSERLEQSYALLAQFVPSLFGALAILFVGYLLAKILEKGTQRLLRRVGFNHLLERGGVTQAVERSGSHLNPAKVIANLLFWIVMFAVLLFAANMIGLDSLTNVFSELVSYIPSVIAAIVIIILGIVLGGFVGGLIMASAGGLHGGPWLARIGRGGVIVLAIFMALQELGIATDIVTTAFAILFGAVALALALSFGLGNRDLAGEVTREWYQRYRAERLAIEAEAAAEEAEELAEEASEVAEDEAAEKAARAADDARVSAAARARVTGATLLFAALPLFAAASPRDLPAQTTKPVAADKAAPKTKSTAAEIAEAKATRQFLAEDENFFDRKLLAERTQYLLAAEWANLGDRCNPGALRVFPKDTTEEQRVLTRYVVERMEATIIARGVGGRLDTPAARALLRTIVGWEAGIDRPHWDADDATARTAVAAGLTGEVPDPRGTGCLASPTATDSVTFVIPGFRDMEYPKAATPRVTAYFGPGAIRDVRNAFFTAVGSKQPDSELSYIRVAPFVVWRTWAIVTVDRPRERAGVQVGAGSNGGATYLLRNTGGEWRLLSIVRSWGS